MHSRLFPCLASLALLWLGGCASTAPRTYAVAPKRDQQAAQPDSAKTNSPRAGLAKTFDEAVARGDDSWRSGEAEMALYLYVQALSFNPRDVTTLKKIGSIEQSRDNLPLAAQAFLLAANTDPADVALTARLGLIYLALGEDDNAIHWLRSSADSGSTDWHVYDGLGIVLQRRGDPGSLQYLQKAVELGSGKSAPLLHQGQAKFKAGDLSGAESALHASLLAGNSPEAWQLLGEIQAKRRAYGESISSLLKALDVVEAYNTVGQLALANGDNKVALSYFEKAAAASPVYLQEVARDSAIARERIAASRH
jgi:tetratricopeptide (TPR) repeat protein